MLPNKQLPYVVVLKIKMKGFYKGSRVAKIIEFLISNDVRFADQTRSTSNFLAKKKGRTLKEDRRASGKGEILLGHFR